MEGSEDRVEDLIIRLQESNGAKLFRRLRVLEQGTKTLKMNHNRLQKAITAARTATVESVQRDTDMLNDAMTLEIATEFHNFLWATKAAYESGETIRRKYFTDEMSEKYRDRLSFRKGRGELLKQLRNHTQHTFPLPVNYPALLRSLTLATWRAGLPVSTTGLAETPTAFEDSPQRSQSPQASDSARPLPISSTGKMQRDGDCTRLFSRLNAGRGVAPVIPQTTISSSIVLTDVSPPYLGLRSRLRTGHCPVIQVNEGKLSGPTRVRTIQRTLQSCS